MKINKIKKIMAGILCISVIFIFAACSSSDGDTTTGDETAVTGEETAGDNASADGTTDTSESAANTNKEYGSLVSDLKSSWDQLYNYGTLSKGLVGDTLSNGFFDWTLNSVKTATTLNGEKAGSGYKFVVMNITVKNTTDYSYSTGNYDFVGIVGTGENDELDTQDSFYDAMYPDDKTLKAGKSLTGDIVIKVKTSVDELILDYEEYYEDGSTGNTNWFDVIL